MPPAYAERVRALAADIYPTEHRQCAQFLRHKAMASSVRQHVQRDNGKPQLAADSASGARPYGVFPIGVSVLVSGLQARLPWRLAFPST